MIITKNKVLISLLHGLRCSNEKKGCFFCLSTTFITPWSKEKDFFFILLLRLLQHDQQKKSLFLIHHYVRYTMVTGKRNLTFTALLPWLRHRKKKFDFYYAATLTKLRSLKNILVFHFTTTFTMQISPYIYLLHSLRH